MALDSLPKPRSLRMLHLSDFHFSEQTSWASGSILNGLAEKVAELQAQGAIQLVFVTGDIAQSGKASDYKLAADWFQNKLRPALGGGAFPLVNFLFVPGNHDVDASLQCNPFKRLRLAVTNEKQRISAEELKECFDGDDSKILRERHAAYLDFVAGFCGYASGESWWHGFLEFGSLKLGVAGISSSWLCDKEADQGKLALGLYQLRQVLEPIRAADLRIALLHHPLGLLIDADAEQAEIYLSHSVQIVLRGHRHRGYAVEKRDSRGTSLWLAAGSAYANPIYENGFQLLEWTPENGKLSATPFLYKNLAWIRDRNQFSDGKDGLGSWEITKPLAAENEATATRIKADEVSRFYRIQKKGNHTDLDAEGMTLCFGCFKAPRMEGTCPNCDWNEKEDGIPIRLKLGTVIGKKYRIGRTLGRRGSYGLVYLAWDMTMKRYVAIKEYLPRDWVTRIPEKDEPVLIEKRYRAQFENGVREFVNEARKLTEFDHPNVIGAIEYLEEKGTAFLVMRYHAGETLAEYLERIDKPLQAEQAMAWSLPLLEALDYIHKKNYLHRDIKPENIYLAQEPNQETRPILLDFGGARQVMMERTRTLNATHTNGYSPLEQYDRAKQINQTSDLYALAAVLYKMLTNETPPAAFLRQMGVPLKSLSQFQLQMKKSLEALVIKGLSMEIGQRPVDAAAFREALMACLRGEIEAVTELHEAEIAPKSKVSFQEGNHEKSLTDDWARLGRKVDDIERVSLPGGVPLEFVWIPPGRFLMGSPNSETDRSHNETQHEVILSQGFWLSQTAVTQAQYEALGFGNPSRFKGAQRPVDTVSWLDAKAYCRKLRQYLGVPDETFRLPTEAEWENACRAGTTTAFSFGDSLDASMANFDGRYPFGKGKKGDFRGETVAVKSFPANAWDLYEMHGNIWEWCEDRYGNYPGGVQIDPQGPGSGEARVLRGGSCHDIGMICRSAFRFRSEPDDRNLIIGFRLVALSSVK